MSILLSLLLAAADPPAPVVGPVADLRQKVVEAIRDCPVPKEGEIVVCSRDRGIAEGYRLPKLDPRFAQRDPKARAPDVLDGVGDTGTGSCSAVGAGGAFGCARRDYDKWGAWRRQRLAERRAAEQGR